MDGGVLGPPTYRVAFVARDPADASLLAPFMTVLDDAMAPGPIVQLGEGSFPMPSSLFFSADSRRLGFIRRSFSAPSNLFALDLTEEPLSPPVRVNDELPPDGGFGRGVFHYRWTGDRVVFFNQVGSSGHRTEVADATSFPPSAPEIVTPAGLSSSGASPPVAGDRVAMIVTVPVPSAPSDHVVYVGDVSTSPPETVRVSPPMVHLGRATTVNLTASGSGLVYRADQEVDEKHELYWVDLSGAAPAAPVKLSPPMQAFGSALFVAFTLDGTRVFFTTRDGGQAIHMVDLAGPSVGQPVELTGNVPAFTQMRDMLVSRDGTALVYLADQVALGVEELFYVDLRGAAPLAPVKISGTLPPDTDVLGASIRLAPDGRGVGYKVRGDAYWVDLRGPTPAAPVQLVGPPDGNIAGIDIAPDSSWLVFSIVEPAFSGNVVSLYRVGLSDGVGDPTLVPAPAGNIKMRVFTPDSRGMLLGIETMPSQLEIYAVDLSLGTTSAPHLIAPGYLNGAEVGEIAVGVY